MQIAHWMLVSAYMVGHAYPAVHTIHAARPPALICPAVHCVSVAAVVELHAAPGLQRVHAACLPSEYVPAAQSVI